MSNLTRYKLKVRWHNEKDGFVAMGVVRERGEWVKFDDIRDEIAALANELEDFNSHRVAPYGRITEIVAKMRQLSPVA